MAADDGPRVAALSFDGWDTHADEGGATGRLAQLLGGLDTAFKAFEHGLGPTLEGHLDRGHHRIRLRRASTARSVPITAPAPLALLTGGAIKGGRYRPDRPGLKDDQLFDRRDLKPTKDLRSVLKGILVEQFDVSPATLANTIFPQFRHGEADAWAFDLATVLCVSRAARLPLHDANHRFLFLAYARSSCNAAPGW